MKICSNSQFNANFGAIFLDNPYFTLKSADLPFTAPLCAIYHWKGNFLRCLEPFLVYLLGSICVHVSKITKKEKKWSTIKKCLKSVKHGHFFEIQSIKSSHLIPLSYLCIENSMIYSQIQVSTLSIARLPGAGKT